MSLTLQEIEYRDKLNRTYMYQQAEQERIDLKKEFKDDSKWNDSDVNWCDWRYMQLCDKAGIDAFPIYEFKPEWEEQGDQ